MPAQFSKYEEMTMNKREKWIKSENDPVRLHCSLNVVYGYFKWKGDRVAKLNREP